MNSISDKVVTEDEEEEIIPTSEGAQENQYASNMVMTSNYDTLTLKVELPRGTFTHTIEAYDQTKGTIDTEDWIKASIDVVNHVLYKATKDIEIGTQEKQLIDSDESSYEWLEAVYENVKAADKKMKELMELC